MSSYGLIPVSPDDEPWLETLRCSVYQELFVATFGGWDEERHARQFRDCWNRGQIAIIEVDGVRVGMIQLFDRPDGIEVGEIQIVPRHQNLGIGGAVLKGVVAQAHHQGRTVRLSVGLKNDRAYRLYQRLGFHKVASSETHNLMECRPDLQ